MCWGIQVAWMSMLLWLGGCGGKSSAGPEKQKGDEITAILPGGAQMEMVWVEPGAFMMGSPSSESGRGDDEVQHQVTISKGFYLGKYEITQGQWQAVMGAEPWSGQQNVQANPNNPAVYISWDDLQEFVQRLNDAEGEAVYRLPTEAEWEYACRAGTTARWSFGDDENYLKDYAWYDATAWNAGLMYAQPVGVKKPNPWGLYDMHGNVWELVQDWYGPYSSDAQADPQGPSSSGFGRGGRGGGFGDFARYARSAGRGALSSENSSSSIGARLLRTQ